jgi:glycosyltransferase involved in cell wall biosynthesis
MAVEKRVMNNPEIPIKVLFIDHESSLGGAELSMVDIIRSTTDDKIEFSAVIRTRGELEYALRDAGIKNIYFLSTESWRWWESGFIARLKLLLSLPRQLYNIMAFYVIYKKEKPDIIHYNLTRIIEPLFASKFAGIPSVMHFREDPTHNNNFFGKEVLLFKFLNLANYWVANSITTRDYIVKNNFKKNPTVILNGIDVLKFKPNRNIKSPIFKVLMLAGIVEWKNHELFLKIAREVISINPKIYFLIAGKGDNKHEQYLKGLVSNWNLDKHVKFIGFVEDTPSLLNSVHLLLHTSGKETFGRVFVEAMACKIPVIATRGGSADEIIGNGISGFTFNKEDVSETANQIIELSRNSDLYQKVSEAARKRAVEEYSLEKLSSNIRYLYKRILY